ncbi:MAG: hypothetical protein ACFWTO_07155 [Hafnia paralvei]
MFQELAPDAPELLHEILVISCPVAITVPFGASLFTRLTLGKVIFPDEAVHVALASGEIKKIIIVAKMKIQLLTTILNVIFIVLPF